MIDPFEDTEYKRLHQIWKNKRDQLCNLLIEVQKNLTITEPLKPGKNPEPSNELGEIIKLFNEVDAAKKNLDDYFYDNEEYFDGDGN